jgi:hypothetical protein
MSKIDYTKVRCRGKRLRGSGIPKDVSCWRCRQTIVLLRREGKWIRYEPNGRRLHQCPAESEKANLKGDGTTRQNCDRMAR